jgi:hypothetical protein|tara:strand:+ start:700 stop:1074 length:375 start_codon:yes stop_codon:yes gene_type:complete
MTGLIYGIKFVNPDTGEKFLKVGIAKARPGKVGKGVLQRGSSKDFYTPDYQQFIQRTWQGDYDDCRNIEYTLHYMFADDHYQPKIKFGGYTECFNINSKILRWFPKKSETAEDWLNRHQNLNLD